MGKGYSAFHVWLDRMAAMRCRTALVRCNGNQRQAAGQIGLDPSTFLRLLARDDAMLLRRAAAENWEPTEP